MLIPTSNVRTSLSYYGTYESKGKANNKNNKI